MVKRRRTKDWTSRLVRRVEEDEQKEIGGSKERRIRETGVQRLVFVRTRTGPNMTWQKEKQAKALAGAFAEATHLSSLLAWGRARGGGPESVTSLTLPQTWETLYTNRGLGLFNTHESLTYNTNESALLALIAAFCCIVGTAEWTVGLPDTAVGPLNPTPRCPRHCNCYGTAGTPLRRVWFPMVACNHHFGNHCPKLPFVLVLFQPFNFRVLTQFLPHKMTATSE